MLRHCIRGEAATRPPAACSSAWQMRSPGLSQQPRVTFIHPHAGARRKKRVPIFMSLPRQISYLEGCTTTPNPT